MNKINEKNIQAIYSAYAAMDVVAFRAFCFEVVSTARAPNYEMLSAMPNMSKNRLLIAVNNFAMKGEGLGVIGR